MKDDVSIEDATRHVELFDTAIAVLAGLMIIPAVFAFSGGDPNVLKAGPSLMFITMPKIFANMGFGQPVGIMFFLLVLFAALTSAIALAESAVSTFEDELHWSRKKASIVMFALMLVLGSLSALVDTNFLRTLIDGHHHRIHDADCRNDHLPLDCPRCRR